MDRNEILRRINEIIRNTIQMHTLPNIYLFMVNIDTEINELYNP